MQNSLERLLGGIAEILADRVETEVADPWVRSQVTAAADLLRQLAVRVTWDLDAATWIAACRGAVEQAIAAAPGRELPASRRAWALGPVAELPSSPAAVEPYLAAHLDALSELAAWSASGDPPPAELIAVIRAAVDAHADVERDLLRAAA